MRLRAWDDALLNSQTLPQPTPSASYLGLRVADLFCSLLKLPEHGSHPYLLPLPL